MPVTYEPRGRGQPYGRPASLSPLPGRTHPGLAEVGVDQRTLLLCLLVPVGPVAFKRPA